MKTSSKLLIILVSCILLCMLAYAHLLKVQFDAGHFKEQMHFNTEKFVFKPVGNFRHLVVEGDLYVDKESRLTRRDTLPEHTNLREEFKKISWGAPLRLYESFEKQGYDVLSGYEGIVKTKIKNDTLFISFFKEKGNISPVHPDLGLVKVYNRSLESIDIRNGILRVKGFEGNKIKISANHSEVDILKVNFDQLVLSGKNKTSIHLDSNRLRKLNYSLQKESKLVIKSNLISKFQKGDNDSLSEISIHGNAQVMEKHLSLISLNN